MRHPPANSSSRNRVKIIGGTWRGRQLRFTDSDGLRPTPNRVRETLFNWLQSDIYGAHCLDLFAGSGALGLEALSRGAHSLTSLEAARPVFANLVHNCESLRAENTKLIPRDALSWLKAENHDEAYDIVFVDPPFTSGLMESSCALLDASGCVAPGSKIYLEWAAPLHDLALPESWRLIRERQAGQVYYGLCLKSAPS